MTVPAASPFDLSGHVALVTGGNSGIGLGMAEGLAAHGADVAIWGTNADKNAAAAEALRTHGGRVLDLVCDVGDEAALEEAMAATLAALGRVDSCFVNAGVGGRAPSFLEMTADEWHRVLRVNLDGAFYTARAAVRHMVERGGGGSIVFTSSGSAYQGQARGQHYGASKAGIVSMGHAIAVEHARDGIRVNSIVAGWTDTGMTAPLTTWQKFTDRVISRVPLRRWGEPVDFAGIAVYLASPASAYHTGDVLILDGGYSVY